MERWVPGPSERKEERENFTPFSNLGNPLTSSPVFSFRNYVESWSGKQVARWIEGLGDAMNPFLGIIRDNIRSGKHLILVDDDMLLRIGISGLGPRKMIVQAIQLLLYFCHEAPSENLQSLAMKVVVACKCVSREMFDAVRMRKKAMHRAQIISILNSTTSSVSVLAEHVKKLIFWLDRSPFDEIDHYVEIRNRISKSILELVRNINVQPKVFFGVAHEIVKQSNELKEQCEDIIRGSDDSALLYTTYMEQVLLRRHDKETNWGINLQSSYRGVHVISEVKIGSPADLCGKIDAGDEVMLINGKTVIGWDLTRIAQRIGSNTDGELNLVINKRPRQAVAVLKCASKPARLLVKMAPGSQATNTAEKEKGFLQEIGYPLNRRRSSSFLTELLNLIELKGSSIRVTRRSSVTGASTWREEYHKEDKTLQYIQWDILDLISHPTPDNKSPAPRIVRRARTMRHQPDGYVRSFIDNKLVQEIDEDVVTDQLPFNIKCPIDFAEISVVEPSELVKLNVVEPHVSDPDWSAPVNDVAVHRFRAPAGDSNLSGFSLDSPRRFINTEDPWITPSPSSPVPSDSSPALGKALLGSGNEWTEEIPLTPSTPDIKKAEKIFEGWVRRRKTGSELCAKEVTNKWPKCWMCLKGAHLLIYANQFTQRPDLVINVDRCVVSDATDLKTSKKFVFRLSRSPMEYHFSCYNYTDMRSWMSKIAFASELYSGHSRIISKSISYFKENGQEDSFTHYNTMTGLPSLMSQSHHEPSSSSSFSSIHNTFPRSGLSSTTSVPKNAGSYISLAGKK